MPLDLGQNPIANPAHQGLVRPRRLTHEVQQRLMFGRHPRRRGHRRQRLHALALQRQQQPKAVILQRLGPICVTDHAHQGLDIGVERRFTLGCPVGHRGSLR